MTTARPGLCHACANAPRTAGSIHCKDCSTAWNNRHPPGTPKSPKQKPLATVAVHVCTHGWKF